MSNYFTHTNTMSKHKIQSNNTFGRPDTVITPLPDTPTIIEDVKGVTDQASSPIHREL
jgi:hypothetical protein